MGGRKIIIIIIIEAAFMDLHAIVAAGYEIATAKKSPFQGNPIYYSKRTTISVIYADS